MSRVADWNKKVNNNPAKRKTKQWKNSMLNQIARLQEELTETYEAVRAGNEVEVLDGLADLRVVLEGLEYLSGLPTQEAFDRVMNNNDLKFTTDYADVAWTVDHIGVDFFHIQEVFYEGKLYYSVHRNKDNKVCKLLGHPKVDLADLV